MDENRELSERERLETMIKCCDDMVMKIIDKCGFSNPIEIDSILRTRDGFREELEKLNAK